MKTKYPKTLWVVFKKGEPKIPLDSAAYRFSFLDKKVHIQKCYHADMAGIEDVKTKEDR